MSLLLSLSKFCNDVLGDAIKFQSTGLKDPYIKIKIIMKGNHKLCMRSLLD